MRARHRVAVDLLYVTGRRGGTETYARELLPRLARLLGNVEFVAFTGAAGAGLVDAWFPGTVHRMRVDARNRAAWAGAEIALIGPCAARDGASLLWCPANYGPVSGSVPTLVTVHDVIPFEHAHRLAAALPRGAVGGVHVTGLYGHTHVTSPVGMLRDLPALGREIATMARVLRAIAEVDD